MPPSALLVSSTGSGIESRSWLALTLSTDKTFVFAALDEV
jgi:hypothetical protein